MILKPLKNKICGLAEKKDTNESYLCTLTSVKCTSFKFTPEKSHQKVVFFRWFTGGISSLANGKSFDFWYVSL